MISSLSYSTQIEPITSFLFLIFLAENVLRSVCIGVVALFTVLSTTMYWKTLVISWSVGVTHYRSFSSKLLCTTVLNCSKSLVSPENIKPFSVSFFGFPILRKHRIGNVDSNHRSGKPTRQTPALVCLMWKRRMKSQHQDHEHTLKKNQVSCHFALRIRSGWHRALLLGLVHFLEDKESSVICPFHYQTKNRFHHWPTPIPDWKFLKIL